MAAADAMSRNQTLLERKEAFKAAAQKLLESKATAAAKDQLDAKDEEGKQETKSKAPQSRKSQTQSAFTLLSASTVPQNQATPPSKRKAF